MSEEEVPEALMAVTSRWEVSLDQPVGADADGCLGDLVAAPAVGEEPEDLLALPGLVASLPEVEREVIVLRFFQDLDQYEIAARGGLLPDARVAPAAPGPGPHACPAGGVLTAKGAMSYRGESLLTGLRTCLLKFA
jgi:hypothetical protein